MMATNLVPISSCINQRQLSKDIGRHEAITALSNELDVTIATLYRWIKSDDHFVCRDKESGTVKVFKQVKALEEDK